jgi:predicted permease
LLRTLWNLETVPLGLDTRAVYVAALTAPQEYSPARRHLFFQQVEERLRRVPGVAQLAVADSVPGAGGSLAMIYSRIEVEGRPAAPGGTGGMVTWRMVTPQYFGALRIPLRAGRAFDEEDRRPGAAPAVILNETLARRLFPEGGALGKRMRAGPENPWWTVVGIAADIRNAGLTNPAEPEYYVARSREVPRGPVSRRAAVLVRASAPRAAIAGVIRGELAALDSTIPVNVEPLALRFARLADRPRFNALLLGLFAGLGAMLAAIGLYGVVAFQAAQRTKEIGVRMALGARPRDIVTLMAGQTARWIAAGACAGLVASWFAAKALRSLVYGVTERDPVSSAAAVLILLAAGALAVWIPARRAASADPNVTLRVD